MHRHFLLMQAIVARMIMTLFFTIISSIRVVHFYIRGIIGRAKEMGMTSRSSLIFRKFLRTLTELVLRLRFMMQKREVKTLVRCQMPLSDYRMKQPEKSCYVSIWEKISPLKRLLSFANCTDTERMEVQCNW